MSANVTTTGFTIRMYLSAPTSHRRVSLQLTSASFIGQCGGVKHFCHLLPGTTLAWPGVGVLSLPSWVSAYIARKCNLYDLQTLPTTKTRVGQA